MPRKTTKIEVGERFEALLKRVLPEMEDRIYWVTDDRPPAHALRDTEIVTFCFTGGPFDYAKLIGGVLDYQATLRVRVWSSDYTDEAGESRQVLTSEPHGLYRFEQRLLTMYDHDLTDENDLDGILLDGLKPLSDDGAVLESGESEYDEFTAMLAIDFGADFQWDLEIDC